MSANIANLSRNKTSVPVFYRRIKYELWVRVRMN